jgi:hypothetical protein
MQVVAPPFDGGDQKNDVKNILDLAGALGAHLNHSRKTISLRAAKRGGFFDELAAGANITIRRRDAILQWFSDHWPEDLEWPEGIPRPPKPEQKREVA